MSDVLFDCKDHVATITLNRPDRLNAISGPMLAEVGRRLIECDSDRDVRVIVITGAGRGFCSGLDLQAVGGGGGKGQRILAAMDEVSARTGAALSEIALAWLAAQPGVTAPIASATSVAQVESLARGARLSLSAGNLETLTKAGL